MSVLSVLFEHAAGYALFEVKEFEEIGMLIPQVEESVTDLKRFNQVVHLTAFSPFKSAVVALENVNSISEGVIPEDLQLFLEKHLSKKRSKVTLGIAESKLAAALSDTLGVACLHTGVVPEILRGIRMHFSSMVKGFTTKSSAVAQLGLGHSYSRAKVKFNVHKVDNMIIQSIALLDQLDKDVNTFSMRIREWYSYHFPELYKIVPENYLYAKLAKFIGNRKQLTENSVDQLEEIIMDRGKAEAILDAAKSSMGMDISPIDLMNIELFASRVVALADYRTEITKYLHSKMNGVAPNLSALVGDQVGARLISKAGSLTNLAKFPASTVQILGAEKALFRALKTRGKTPKYGLLFNSSFIARAEMKNRGRMSRYLANKCSIASRIDCFADSVTSVFGEKLREQVEERLKFFQTGEIPKKNTDAMKEAVQQLTEIESAKKKKKKKKRKLENGENELNGTEEAVLSTIADEEEAPVKKKKKKKKAVDETVTTPKVAVVNDTSLVEETSAKKKKNKKKSLSEVK